MAISRVPSIYTYLNFKLAWMIVLVVVRLGIAVLPTDKVLLGAQLLASVVFGGRSQGACRSSACVTIATAMDAEL